MNPTNSFKTKAWWAIPSSGILIGLNAPGFGTQWIGFLALIPLLLVLEKTFSDPLHSTKRKLLQTLVFCWLAAGLGSSIGAYWITHSAHVFGHLPWLGATGVTFIGYGFEVGLLLWLSLAGPLVFIRHDHLWGLPLRIFWFVVVDANAPRLIDWNFGGLTLSGFPLVEQSADLIGSSGLSLFMVSSNLLLVAWSSSKTRRNSFKILTRLSLIYMFLFLAAAGYGYLKKTTLKKSSSENSFQKVWIGAVQPNFSLQDLASNPELAHSERKQNLGLLLEDSENLLKDYPVESGLPKLIVWPESVFPDPFFKKDGSRKRVQEWARKHQTSILLASIDWEMDENGQRFFGISVMVGPDGKIIGRYNKMFLIPFGETLPFADWFPEIANWLRKKIHNMSQFERGTEYTVFELNQGLKVSASICFDIFSREIVRNMTRNGAGFIANLSNLAWFGKTTATQSMETFIRWRAIENRVPVLFATNNGSSILIGPDGQPLSPRLELFEAGHLGETVLVGSHYSFYREHSEIVQISFILLMLVFGWVAVRKQKNQSGSLG